MLADLVALRRDLESSLVAELGGDAAATVVDNDGSQPTTGALVPFGVLLGATPPLAALVGTHRWGRLLSWLDSDPHLAATARHLDRVLSIVLPAAAPHAIAVRDTVPRSVSTPPAATALAPHLRSPRARYLCYAVIAAEAEELPALAETLLLSDDVAQYDAWRRAMRLDEEVTTLLRAWSSSCPKRMQRHTDVTLAVDYPLARRLLERHFQIFESTP